MLVHFLINNAVSGHVGVSSIFKHIYIYICICICIWLWLWICICIYTWNLGWLSQLTNTFVAKPTGNGSCRQGSKGLAVLSGTGECVVFLEGQVQLVGGVLSFELENIYLHVLYVLWCGMYFSNLRTNITTRWFGYSPDTDRMTSPLEDLVPNSFWKLSRYELEGINMWSNLKLSWLTWVFQWFHKNNSTWDDFPNWLTSVMWHETQQTGQDLLNGGLHGKLFYKWSFQWENHLWMEIIPVWELISEVGARCRNHCLPDVPTWSVFEYRAQSPGQSMQWPSIKRIRLSHFV